MHSAFNHTQLQEHILRKLMVNFAPDVELIKEE